jgi:hypothetical protein
MSGIKRRGQLYLGGRQDKARDRRRLLDAVSCRMQSFFITMRASFPEDAVAILERAERKALTLRRSGGHHNNY